METIRDRDTIQETMDRRLKRYYYSGNGEMLFLSKEEAEMFRREGMGQYINGVHEKREQNPKVN